MNGFRPDLRDAGVWARKLPGLRHLVLGTPWTEIDERVRPADDDVVLVKQYPSAFFGTSLAVLGAELRLQHGEVHRERSSAPSSTPPEGR